MALLFCVNAYPSSFEFSTKTTREYFADFLFFLHSVLRHNEYLKLLTYEFPRQNSIQQILKETVDAICYALYRSLNFYEPISGHIQKLIEKANEMISHEHEEAINNNRLTWNILASENKALTKVFKNCPSRHIRKVISILQEENSLVFDPFHQQALPARWYDLTMGSHTMSNLHLPCPTSQEFIHKVSILDEFKVFLRHYAAQENKQKHLMMNLQDRTAWREYYRSIALEEFQEHEEFRDVLNVATLAKDTEFYYQEEPYSQMNHAEVFFKHLYKQVASHTDGFFFAEEIYNALLPQFVESLIQSIHKVFFYGKNILLREHRLDFIEIFLLFLQLKLMDIYKPASFSLTCKDGADTSASANAELFVFLKLIKGEDLTKKDRVFLNQVLYAPAILLRERLIQSERFHRFLSAVKCLELVKEQRGLAEFSDLIKGTFAGLFDMPITEAVII
jgi:hypothetical protein